MIASLISWLKKKRAVAAHWVIAVGLIVLGVWAGEWLGEHQYWIELRYKIYQFLTSETPHPMRAHRTILVLIGDEEYWKGKPAGRSPINRSYLADLIKAVDAANPEVIAIDFDLRTPLPDGSPVNYTNYQAETQELLDTVKTVSTNRVVVLSKTLGFEGNDYVRESDIYDGAHFDMEKVKQGYIELPDDMRLVPLSLPVRGGGSVDSFSQAIVRASESSALAQFHETDSLPYGTFMPPEQFVHFSSLQVLAGDTSVLKQIAHKIVIVGGDWHSRAYERGGAIDEYLTPVGWIPGAYIHANYVEALLDGRTARAWSDAVAKAIEIVVALIVAVVFALRFRPWKKLLTVVCITLALAIFSYFSLQNLGLFFDFFIPSILLFGHFATEHWINLERESRRLKKRVRELETPAADTATNARLSTEPVKERTEKKV